MQVNVKKLEELLVELKAAHGHIRRNISRVTDAMVGLELEIKALKMKEAFWVTKGNKDLGVIYAVDDDATEEIRNLFRIDEINAESLRKMREKTDAELKATIS
jgi:hypothetical protein